MSQPPFNQPPSQGFGPPQEPPPSYGYPQYPAPPQQPPQQPPPPPQQPPAGPPQPGVPPHGQYGHGYGYGGYGQYPQQPAPGAGGQPTAGGGGGKGKVLAIVAAVVAVLLLAGGGVWFLTGDEGEKTARKNADTGDGAEAGKEDGSGEKKDGTERKGRAELAWKVDPAELPDLDRLVFESHGTWFAGGNLVNASFDAVTAYDMETGEEAWSIDLTRGPKCVATPRSSDGKAVLQWGRRCEKVMAIDLVRGKELWRKDLPSEDSDMNEFGSTEMALSGGTVAAAWNGNAVGYDLDTGKRLWETEENSDCGDTSYVGGSRLIAKVECDYGQKQSLQLVEEDGGKGWEWKAPGETEIVHIYSVDPPVFGVRAGDSIEITDIMILDDKGKQRSKITIPEKRYRFICEGITLAGCFNVVVDKANDALYLQTYLIAGENGTTADIEAFNLSDGKPKWRSEPTGERLASPLTMHDGKLMGYETYPMAKAGVLTLIDPETGEASPYMELPAEEEDAQRSIAATGSGRPYWQDGGLFLVRHTYYDDAGSNKGGILAFR
ncbi:PQQ-like beta-propeller repeat protein [Streptomyces sp. S1A]|uniref:outer membrane protein assembly factor BamB family protein n=1 Tax=Streptomyces sp. ICN903 TaxID=2964654 RepID=UPI001EDA4E80|nr:PQQ-binding-like beta-propeller repeat protein [Streptomyces sp. ICN903]MCG3041771.1 PQQ-like beta-propeller repeat protein [Streptomyces sp. ICN903]